MFNTIKVNNTDTDYTHSIFDISDYNSGATYTDLSAALAAIPESKQHGGMTVCYVQTDDHKYVQYRLVVDEFTTDITQWQGVTSELKYGSKDLVESGAVFGSVNDIEKRLSANGTDADFSIADPNGHEILKLKEGGIQTKNFDSVKTPFAKDGAEGDFDLTDEHYRCILRLEGGNIKTKNFDSKFLYKPLEKFRDKTIGIIGDSISTFAGWLPSDVQGYDGETYNVFYPSGTLTSVTQTWWYKLAVALGLDPATKISNCSWSGSGVTGNTASTSSAACAGSTKRINDLSLRLNNNAPDIIICLISVNDFMGGSSQIETARPIGTWKTSDPVPSDGVLETLRQGYARMLYKIHTTYPSSRVFCCTILDDRARDAEAGWPSNNSLGVATDEWNTNIIEISRAMGCDVINLHECGMNWCNMATYCIDQGLHPNPEGHTLMANKIFAEMIAKY